MNPVLLKPQGETGAQVILQGKIFATVAAREYQRLRPSLLPKVLESFCRIAHGVDLVLVEGAGSAAEINLREGDIANMGFAEAADLPVALIGDIERGGVIAQIVGTHILLSEGERCRLKGFIVNKFRGDPSLFDGGLSEIVDRTGLQGFGVVPWFEGANYLPAEDSLALTPRRREPARPIKIVALAYPRIANFDDFDPIRAEGGVSFQFLRGGEAVPGDADLVILPGSKATLSDLAFLRAQGWDIDLLAHHRRGGVVLGICAGYQMLGTRVADPEGIEGPAAEVSGLGMLDIETVMSAEKSLVAVRGREVASGLSLSGYEMHVGRTTGEGMARPMLALSAGRDGAVSKDGRVMGCYVHGMFAADTFRRAFLKRLGENFESTIAYQDSVEATLDRLADHLERHLDLNAMLAIARREENAAPAFSGAGVKSWRTA